MLLLLLVLPMAVRGAAVCPLAVPEYDCRLNGQMADAHDYTSRRSTLHRVVYDAFVKRSLLAGRRLVLWGDSPMHQQFVAIGCSLHRLDAACVINATGTVRPCTGGEVVYWGPGDTPATRVDGVVRNLTLLDRSGGKEGGIWLDGSPMGPDDVVVYSTGSHLPLDHYRRGLERLLLAFVDNVHAPYFLYLVTPQQHYATPTGEYDTGMARVPCARRRPRARQDAEVALVYDTDPMAYLVDVNLTNAGHLHIGGVDCLRYCHPGVPDVIAGKLIEAVVEALE